MDDFESHSWHDNLIYGLHFQCAEPDREIWVSNLVLDIDHITEWVHGEDGIRFRVAPATLVFHNVCNLAVNLPGAPEGGGYSLTPLSISEIFRGPRELPRQSPATYYTWQIELNHPARGNIRFEATDFTQTYREEPVLRDEQHLAANSRPALVLPAV